MTTDRTRSEGMDPTRAQMPTPALDELAPAEPSPRAAVVASLAETLTRAVALGDEVAARVVHEAILAETWLLRQHADPVRRLLTHGSVVGVPWRRRSRPRYLTSVFQEISNQ
ncbi:hypothetical protein [Sorangium sp. So ce1099]|uniref:hypothetical protein n=1 Tax=Sorangium sp. So ce1099 TaxID=3133331 RepID=UPI003F621295